MMKMIPFTQFLRPNGRARQVAFEASGDTEEMAQSLIEKGARFEIEVLMNGVIHMDCQIGDKLWVRETHFLYGHWIKNGFTGQAERGYGF